MKVRYHVFLISSLLILISFLAGSAQTKKPNVNLPALPSAKFSPLELPQAPNTPSTEVEEEGHPDLLSNISAEELKRLKNIQLPPMIDEHTTIDRSVGRTPQSKVLAPALGTNFAGIVHTGFIPPDDNLTVGPTHILEAVNSRLVGYTKSGSQVFSATFADWFANVQRNPSALSDPRLLYDLGSQRFIIVMIDFSASPRYLISVSTTSSATGTWINYSLDADNGTGTWADYPCIGVDSNAVYIGSNNFNASDNTFGFNRIRILRKDSLYSAHQLPYLEVLPGGFTQQPAFTVGSSPTIYVLTKSNGTGSSITLGTITNPLTSPAYAVQANVSVRAFGIAPDAVQPSGVTPINNLDGRLGSTVIYRNGFVYLVFGEPANFGSGTVAAMRYVKINTTTNTAVIDETFGADGIYYIYPSVTVDGSGNAYFTFSRSSTSEFVSAHFTGRNAVNASIQSSSTLMGGAATYSAIDGQNRNRWGDYTGVAMDPADGKTAWFVGEYASSQNQWSTWIGSTTFAQNSISGKVYHDSDQDVHTSSDRHLLPGWGVFLYQNSVLVESTATNASGQYTFDSLASGTYTIIAGLQPGDSHVDVIPGNGTATETRLNNFTIQVTVSTAQTSINNNLLVYVNRVVSGIKFEDVNNDTIHQIAEPGVANWRIRIARNGLPWDSAMTNGNGEYRFTGLINGTYTVSEAPRPYWVQTYPSSGTHIFNITSSIDTTGVDFGNFHLGTISGVKFHDLNDNGTKDGGEPSLPGWKIYLHGTKTDSTITDALGQYHFDSLFIGSYTVSEGSKPNWRQTLPPSFGSYSVTIDSSGKVKAGRDFGNFSTHTVIGEKFNDHNGDGILDNGETGLSSWLIFADGPTHDSAFTDAQGRYVLGGLSTGTYTIHEQVKTGWMQTMPANPDTYQVTFTASESQITGRDFGNFRLASISGVKYEDKNSDGIRAQTDSGVSGWKMYLYQNNVLEDSTLTDINGTYNFLGLSAGSYKVLEEHRQHWLQVTPDSSYSVVLSSGDSVGGKDFGNFHLGIISGHVYEDRNTVGANDGDPTVLVPWKIILEPSSAPPETTTTDENGAYQFADLRHDTYTLHQILPSGWTDTYRNGSPHIVLVLSGLDTTGLDFGNFYDVSAQTYRTATSEDWATGGNLNLPIFKSMSRRADKVFFKFNLGVPAHVTLSLKFSQNTSGKVYRGKSGLPVDSIYAWTGFKELSFLLPGIGTGDTIEIIGQGDKGKKITVQYQWLTFSPPPFAKIPDDGFKQNFPGLPMPNLHNAGDELFPKGYHQLSSPFPTGLVVGIPQGDKKPHTVLHKRYSDVKKSLWDRNIHLHTHTERCLDRYDATLDSIKRQVTGLPAGKHNNRLFAELLALKLDIAASQIGKFPSGLGQLVYYDRSNPSDLFNQQSVNNVATIADSFITCLPVKLQNTPLTPSDVYNVVRRITSAFRGTMDTFSFSAKFSARGVRPLYEVSYLQFDSTAVIPPVPLGSVDNGYVPTSFSLHQNYPNPFNPTTTIEFDLPEQAFVTLTIYNVLGQQVATLLDHEQMDEGNQMAQFDAGDFASGIYFYRLVAEGFNDNGRTQQYHSVKKMMLIK